MKADPASQRTLLDLAEVDAELHRIDHRRRTLPELDEIAGAERDAQAKRDALVAAQTAFGDIDRDAKRLETEIDQVRAREDRDRKLMDAGGAAKQLEELQHELETLTRRQGELEDELLEVMERREALEADVEHSRQDVTAAEERLAEAQHRRDQALADLDSTEAKRTSEREVLVAELPSELIGLYDRLLKQKGVGAAPLTGRRCGACRIELGTIDLNRIREAAADDVVRCEECGAILVRTGGPGQ